MAVQLYLGLTLGSGAAHCAGPFDDKDRCSWTSASNARTHVAAGPPVGDSVNIHKLYVTFITFSLGFRGDGVGVGSPCAELKMGILFS